MCLIGGADKNVVVFDKNEEQIVATLKGHTKKVTSVIYHPSQVIVETNLFKLFHGNRCFHMCHDCFFFYLTSPWFSRRLQTPQSVCGPSLVATAFRLCARMTLGLLDCHCMQLATICSVHLRIRFGTYH